ncbi:MAG: LL-diaminopimelate aminotransferase [Chlamydiia bacterium]|nr:LL-diaminopimelate aminotransferase [Chlamydiia bacterium]
MVERNPHFHALSPNYLFPEIHKRKMAFQKNSPEAKILSLGIGDTTQPIAQSITSAMQQKAQELSTKEGYTGYGAPEGMQELRKQIATTWYETVEADEIFISDGAKCDCGRLAVLFGGETTVAVQDPAYPVYVDSTLITGNPERLHFMPCTPDNNFFPDLNHAPATDLIYLCYPNNPTGTVATHKQLEAFVAFAKANNSIIIYDAAYAGFIRNPDIPKTIYAIPGAKEVAIEINSFSKLTGFTGVRLGWTVIPKELTYTDGSPVHPDWARLHSTLFNGASNVVQAGGLAALTPHGLEQIKKRIDYYLINAHRLKEVFMQAKLDTYGGKHAPFLFVHFPGQDSWDLFDLFLKKAHLVTTPGVGFGPSGESFLRFSAFGNRADIDEACSRLAEFLPTLT